jgi:hypothetical protein
MIPYGRNLLSKGLLALRKGVSLATKGMLDVYRRIVGHAYEERYKFKRCISVIGRKAFSFEFCHLVQGFKKFKLKEYFTLIGLKSFLFKLKKNITSKLASVYKELLFIDIQGQVQTIFEHYLALSGNKEFSLHFEKSIYGKRQLELSIEKEIIAKKLYEFAIGKELKGIKQIELEKSYSISGKRDIIPIIMATLWE